MILLAEDRPAKAVSQFELAFELDAQSRYKLPVAVLASGRYLLGVAYAKLGKLEKAREILREALAIDPGYEDAQLLLQKLGR